MQKYGMMEMLIPVPEETSFMLRGTLPLEVLTHERSHVIRETSKFTFSARLVATTMFVDTRFAPSGIVISGSRSVMFAPSAIFIWLPFEKDERADHGMDRCEMSIVEPSIIVAAVKYAVFGVNVP